MFDLDRNDISGDGTRIPDEYVGLSAEQRFQQNKVKTDERDVTNAVNDFADGSGDNSLSLLMAQAHFPVVAAPEMGEVDSDVFADNAEYREFVASRLSNNWDDLFSNAFGDNEKTYLRISRSLAAYQASQLFIENPCVVNIERMTHNSSATVARLGNRLLIQVPASPCCWNST